MKVLAPVLLVVMLLASCGGETPTKKPTPTEPTTPSPTIPALDGTFAPESLTEFRCALAADKKSWTATGVIANRTKAVASFQLTVYVGDVGTSGQGATKKFDAIQAGGSVPAELTGIPGPGDADATCNAQLVRLD